MSGDVVRTELSTHFATEVTIKHVVYDISRTAHQCVQKCIEQGIFDNFVYGKRHMIGRRQEAPTYALEYTTNEQVRPPCILPRGKIICSLLGTARTMILPWRHCTRLYGGESLEWEIKNQAMLTLHATTCCVQRIDKKDGTYRANPCQHSDAMAQKIGWC